MALFHLGTFEKITLALLVATWGYQLWFLFKRIAPLSFYKPKETEDEPLPSVSVIICAKDEARNLQQFLPKVLTQDYPHYQVVVVNDNSEDETEEILSALKKQHNHLYTTTLQAEKKFYRGKKVALSLGIKAASNDLLVLTDADCEPASDQWLAGMARALTQPGKELVLGIGNYQKHKGLLNYWVRYDTFSIAIQYLGYALSRKPYMGVGRNLAYKKSLFNKNQGFKNHLSIASGDDDLFVQETASPSNTNICISPDTHTLSTPPRHLREWLKQKQRHLSTSGKYSFSLKMELILEPGTRIIFWILTLYHLIFHNFAVAAIGFWFTLMAIKLFLWHRAALNTGLGNIYRNMLIFDFLQPLILFMAHAGNLTETKTKRWK